MGFEASCQTQKRESREEKEREQATRHCKVVREKEIVSLKSRMENGFWQRVLAEHALEAL